MLKVALLSMVVGWSDSGTPVPTVAPITNTYFNGKGSVERCDVAQKDMHVGSTAKEGNWLVSRMALTKFSQVTLKTICVIVEE